MPPSLPSLLPHKPALQDIDTTPEQLQAALDLAKVTSPDQTPIYICAFQNCFRLYPTRDRLMLHRKRDHDSQDDSLIITWNE
ncbi:putative zinc finger [Lyophyllum shimeji]|uniref:Zinc finger n=1 Tax=Lyophyllum shimeji TaxID=47721 RepID=A0A9P3PHC6_LYOSH|nr:putative zinc finger [Lyophyllum shimeji]